MKKFFNLTVALFMAMSSLLVTSCDDDDNITSEEQSANKTPQTYNIPTGVQVSYIKAYASDSYVIENQKLGIYGVSLNIMKIEDSVITISVKGFTLTISDDPDYESCVLYVPSNKSFVPATLEEAKTNPRNVVFVCQDVINLVSGSEANDVTISKAASKTTFEKWDDSLVHDFVEEE